MALRIAWIGLGNMGRGMARNLATQGPLDTPLAVFNRTTSRAETFASANPNIKVASNLDDAITSSDIIFTCLSDDHALRETITESLPNAKNKLFVDCSTVHPDTTTEIATTLSAHGASFVASPVFGAPAMAEAGPSSSIDRLKPYTTGVISKANIEFRDKEVCKASQLKVPGNTFVLNMVQTIAEGMVVAEKSGLGTEALQQFIEAVFPGAYDAYAGRMRSGDYFERAEPLFAVDLVRKDARHAMDMAASVGATMRGVQSADAYLADVKAEMGVRGDITGIYGAVRQNSGLPFKN
ncbi:uncharacterized protein N7483_006871 [Penicillium malachiteum]|uniref:uncharacterized protein n=1 Tax=Penicillium malachiteum TaxID=1324776 RepID=UPI002546ABA5|nr:uncharacterized protein N7483_006871 [Penicillium malachiteum]KAJ5725514.1 hypothetical protein N7483_006871 [Penicillium malachiteum]